MTEYENMTGNDILETFFRERNSAENTQRVYHLYIRHYEEYTGHNLERLLQIAEDEETQNIRWRNTRTREWLIQYREHLYNTYSVNTAKTRLGVIITVYRHFEHEIPALPYFSQKNLQKATPILYDDLPDREVLTQALDISTIRTRAILLFMSSSGLSRIDTGCVGTYRRLRPHMLRKYHASQLAEAGMSTEKINLLQGRKVKGVAHESYIRIKTDTLKQEYIQALPYLVVEDINKVKTELQSTKEELKTVTSENEVMRNNLKDILSRIKKLEEK